MFVFIFLGPRHLKHPLTCKPGLQNLEEVPGLVFCEGLVTPEEETYCIERIDNVDCP